MESLSLSISHQSVIGHGRHETRPPSRHREVAPSMMGMIPFKQSINGFKAHAVIQTICSEIERLGGGICFNLIAWSFCSVRRIGHHKIDILEQCEQQQPERQQFQTHILASIQRMVIISRIRAATSVYVQGLGYGGASARRFPPPLPASCVAGRV